MYVTNLTNDRLGINGVVNLAPREVNLYIDNKDLDLVERVVRLEAAKLVSVVREKGLTKTGITGKIVKTVGAQPEALSLAPRTPGIEMEEVKAPEVKEEAAKTTDEEITETAKETLEEEATTKAPEAIEEVKEEEVVVEKPKKSRKAKVAEAVAKATE